MPMERDGGRLAMHADATIAGYLAVLRAELKRAATDGTFTHAPFIPSTPVIAALRCRQRAEW
jgi:hypothetical protein